MSLESHEYCMEGWQLRDKWFHVIHWQVPILTEIPYQTVKGQGTTNYYSFRMIHQTQWEGCTQDNQPQRVIIRATGRAGLETSLFIVIIRANGRTGLEMSSFIESSSESMGGLDCRRPYLWSHHQGQWEDWTGDVLIYRVIIRASERAGLETTLI